MPRSARVLSKHGIYHVILRGIDRQVLFEDEGDFIHFKDTLKRYKIRCSFALYAYCLMGNHAHLLIRTKEGLPSDIIKRISSSYVYWYNKKYRRIGHLLQERYRSEPVNDDTYLLTVIRYIHQNPIKAGLTKTCSYPYSSYVDYVDDSGDKLADTAFLLSFMGKDEFVEFHATLGEDACVDVTEPHYGISDEEAIDVVKGMIGASSAKDLQYKDPGERLLIIRELRARGISVRQLSRVSGVSRGIIQRA